MELSGDNLHIHQNEVDQIQTEWNSDATAMHVNTTTFSRITGPNTYKRLWRKLCQAVVCTALIETASLCGFAEIPRSITSYTQPFVSTQSARCGGDMRMNDIREWKKKKEHTLLQMQDAATVTPEALAFIEKNRFLIPILISANKKLLEYFPKDKLCLDIVNDPEDSIDSLLLAIESSLEPELALEKLHQFDQEWWLDVVSETNDKLCINVVFS